MEGGARTTGKDDRDGLGTTDGAGDATGARGKEDEARPTAERAGHRLYAQILWTTLGELPLVGPRRAAAIEGHLIALCRRLDVEPVAVSATSDRVHLLVRFKPTHSLSAVASRLKGGSSDALVRMRTPVRWGAGYAVASVGPAEVRRLMRELVVRGDRFSGQGRALGAAEGAGTCAAPSDRHGRRHGSEASPERPRRAGPTRSVRRPGLTRVLTRLPPPG